MQPAKLAAHASAMPERRCLVTTAAAGAASELSIDHSLIDQQICATPSRTACSRCIAW
jgi:hypothetical protein